MSGDERSVLSPLGADFRLRSLPSTITIGVVFALVNALLTIALVSLIFRGDLAEALPSGIGLGLVTSAVIGLVLALGSSFPGMFAGVQDASAAIVGLSAASIAAVHVGAETLDTVLVMLAITSLATGGVFLAMGHFGLGDVARFVPFPVIGGLLAGTGYLILRGSLAILGVESASDLTGSGVWGLLVPGLLLGSAFFLASRRGWGSRSYLLFLVIAIAGFHLTTLVAGVDRGEALERGWLLGPFPDGGLWPGWALGSLGNVDWGLIAGETAGLLTILLILPISLLLYISGLEIETKADVDMNRELRATGWANVAAGVVGGPPGYMYLADTVIAARLVGRRRGPAVVAPVVIIVVVAVGGPALEFLPQFVVGGMLLFVGAEFLYEWLWVSRRRMNRIDYALIWGILVTIAVVGFLPGVAVGLVAAIALFVIRYSMVDVVKHELTGSDRQSNIERSATDAEFLASVGDAVMILELQGFVFFGTAARVLSHLRATQQVRSDLQFVIFDFRRVTGIDSSAVALFERVALMARERGLSVVFTAMSQGQTAQFADLVLGYDDVIIVHEDLDHGLAWCEERLLESAGLPGSAERSLPEGLPENLSPYLEERSFAPGEVLMRQGDPTSGIFLIASGRATVLMEDPDGGRLRLRTILSGTVLGEISLYRGEPCTATVVADTPCEVLHLTPRRFAELCETAPAIAADLHAFVARTLAGRVTHANRAMRALHD